MRSLATPDRDAAARRVIILLFRVQRCTHKSVPVRMRCYVQLRRSGIPDTLHEFKLVQNKPPLTM